MDLMWVSGNVRAIHGIISREDTPKFSIGIESMLKIGFGCQDG